MFIFQSDSSLARDNHVLKSYTKEPPKILPLSDKRGGKVQCSRFKVNLYLFTTVDKSGNILRT